MLTRTRGAAPSPPGRTTVAARAGRSRHRARRGELAALKVGDLQGRVLHIARAASMEQVGPTKTRRSRRLTVGATTAGLWHDLVETWSVRAPTSHSATGCSLGT